MEWISVYETKFIGVLVFLGFFILLVTLCCCSDHRKVMKEYKNGNKNASDLLLHGFQSKNSEYISSEIIDKALQGDEEAKQIVYAQINSGRK